MNSPMTEHPTDALLPCRECGAPCRVEHFHATPHRSDQNIWVCSQHDMFGGKCPSDTAYLFEGAWNMEAAKPSTPAMEMLHFVFDGPPGPECGRFVECETPDGHGVNAGEWHERANGFWELRVSMARAPSTPIDDEGLRSILTKLLKLWDNYLDSDLNQMNAHDCLVRYGIWNEARAAIEAKPSVS